MKCKKLINEIMKLVNKHPDIKIIFNNKIKLINKMLNVD